MDNNYPVLYILMRDDLDSMNPGKAIAQGAHAANLFIHDVNSTTDTPPPKEDQVRDWQNSTTQGFGTTITLAISEDELYNIVDMAKRLGYFANVTHDPTYPLRDGRSTHLIPVNTCGYVFGMKGDDVLKTLLQDLILHP